MSRWQAFIRWEEGDPSAVSLRDVLDAQIAPACTVLYPQSHPNCSPVQEALLASRPVDPGLAL